LEEPKPQRPGSSPPRESTPEEYRRLREAVLAGKLTPAPRKLTPAPLPKPLPSTPRKTGEFLAVAGQMRSPEERLMAVAAMMEEGQFDGALKALEKLCKDEPNHLDSLLTLGNVHSLLGHTKEARAAFAQALVAEPLCVEARIFGGVAALQTQDFKEAKAEFGRALFLEPTLALSHYLLARTLEQAGEPDAARRSYRNALSQLKTLQRPLAGHYPDIPESTDALARTARYALAALEENTRL
jgi:chemotaxis protein methyltransferase CheR